MAQNDGVDILFPTAPKLTKTDQQKKSDTPNNGAYISENSWCYNMLLAGGNSLDGHPKVDIFQNGLRGDRGQGSTCTRPNIMPVAARIKKLRT